MGDMVVETLGLMAGIKVVAIKGSTAGVGPWPSFTRADDEVVVVFGTVSDAGMWMMMRRSRLLGRLQLR